MCDSLHPFRVHADHLTITKTDRYGLMVPYTFFSFPRQAQCLPGIFVSRPSLSRFRVGEFTAFPSLERPCRGKPYPGAASATPPSFPNRSFRQERPNALPSESGSSGGHNDLKSIFKMERKIYDFRGVKVSLRKESYRTNGTLAVIMDEVYHASFRSIPEINLSVSSRKYMERWCPLFSEWRLDETIAREADVLAVVDKGVSDLQTGRNTVVCSSVVHIFPFLCLAGVVLLPPDS